MHDGHPSPGETGARGDASGRGDAPIVLVQVGARPDVAGFARRSGALSPAGCIVAFITSARGGVARPGGREYERAVEFPTTPGGVAE